MANDIFSLGGVIFDDFSTPEHPPFGGGQNMVVHKLPGGQRVIDTLGPDDADYTFHGIFWGPYALANADALDAMRSSGAVTTLSWGGRSWQVIVRDVSIECCRYPTYYKYSVTVVVASSALFGALGFIIPTVDALILSDMNSAVAIATANAGTLPAQNLNVPPPPTVFVSPAPAAQADLSQAAQSQIIPGLM